MAVAVAVVWLAFLAAQVVTGSAPEGLRPWEPMVPFVLLSGSGVVMSIRQARAERAELERGYSTIPSREAADSQPRSS
ncbi:hypothetical protein [Arthrobacter sp. MMS18-M83]|uniref:hypothetical protein n=1 Tax=Arthrobacter sp. MMS18-M83 TaxID=2996261 RepID=UPI00227B5277|nr:hypothetical protein [Arthrobacter sp. MMS18-M83]WAH98838.1 hypothetical protein OW521_08410 [Arthrobacter sp. MMS18-M83]